MVNSRTLPFSLELPDGEKLPSNLSMKTKRPINCCFPGLEASSSVEITFYPLNVGAEKLAAQEPVLGGEGPALPSRVVRPHITRYQSYEMSRTGKSLETENG